MPEKMVVGFGEVMLRLSPPEYQRFIQADRFVANYTGAEANAMVSLSRLGVHTELVTKLPDNEIAQCAVATLHKYDVGTSRVLYGGDRLGVYYSERGASQRPSKVVYDRKYSSISMAERGEFDWEDILNGADAFLFTGITAALGPALPDICADACKAAKRHGVKVFCDLNYRKKLWSTERASQVMTALMPYIDVLMGNEEDSEAVLGIKPSGSDVLQGKLSPEGYEKLAEQIGERFGTEAVAFTLRESLSASDNNWAAMIWHNGEVCFSKKYPLHIVDRMGGGDSFGAALIYAFLHEMQVQEAIEFAASASCLKHSIDQDFNLSTLEEILTLKNGDSSGRIRR